MARSTSLKPWKTLGTRELFVAEPWVRLSVQQVLLPDGKVVNDYYQIKLSEYVVIFAWTTDGKVILERLYKHGIGKVTITLPEGRIEENEDTLDAAKRELLEETGYASEDWQGLGSYFCSANYGCGKVHMFVAKDAHRIAEPRSEDLEQMEVILMQPKEIIEAIHHGEISALGVVAAIAIAMNPTFITPEAGK